MKDKLNRLLELSSNPPIIKDLPIPVKVTTFKKGDLLCHENNYDNGHFTWFHANEDDVKDCSGQNGYYYKIEE